MNNQSLDKFISQLSNIWGPVSSDLTKQSKQLLQELVSHCINEDWMRAIIAKQQPETEVYRSAEHGFILQAHVEQQGTLSPPHDHGNGWVLYATVKGQVEMGVFHRVIQADGSLKVVQKDQYIQQPGQCHVYLVGDIHDTHALEDNTVMLRLTSCDFHQEFNEGRLIRYLSNSEKW